MNKIIDIPYEILALSLLVLVPSFIIIRHYGLNLEKKLSIAVLRMVGQLLLIGLFLEYLFELNNWLVTIAWFIVIVFFASYSSLSSSDLNWRKLFVPAMAGFALPIGLLVLFFNVVLLQLDQALDARYFISLSGMIAGNSLKAVIVSFNSYVNNLQEKESLYQFISCNKDVKSARLPFIRKALIAGLKPYIANTATVGLVFIPGMMTGQILGGASSIIAVKYQIAIMLIIFSSISISLWLSLFLLNHRLFDGYDNLNKNLIN